MGLFGKKKKEEEQKSVSELQELPRLPELPKMDNQNSKPFNLSQLPSFPSSSIGEKFSRNTIKEAVSGEKVGDNFPEEDFDADDFGIEDETQMMPNPQGRITPRRREMSSEFEGMSKFTKKAEPVFIRLDKFEESLQLFEKTKKQISEIEKMLAGIKKIKEHEEEDLSSWENEIHSIKNQIEKVDNDIFSKI